MSTDTDEIKIPFWGSNPNIILQSDYVTELFPVESMIYEQKLNAITRGILLISIVSFALTRNFRIIVVSILTILSIYLLQLHQERENDKKKKVVEEKFVNPADDVLKSKSILRDASVFDTPDSSNPFGNTLVTDYQYNPNKKPAPPAFNESVNEKILAQAKTLVKELNPDQPDISDKLFKDLGEQYVFEQSLRQFTSNPSTTVMNDQTGFADFCYGSMTSCKEGNLFACARNLPRHLNY